MTPLSDVERKIMQAVWSSTGLLGVGYLAAKLASERGMRVSEVRTHRLKCWPGPYREIVSGRKAFEIRKNDRGYVVGDLLVLEEWDPAKIQELKGRLDSQGQPTNLPVDETVGYTGRSVRALVTSVAEAGTWGLPPDVCVLGILIETRAEIELADGSGHVVVERRIEERDGEAVAVDRLVRSPESRVQSPEQNQEKEEEASYAIHVPADGRKVEYGTVESLESQVGRLASFIMEKVPGEPSRSEGAIDTAIRIIGNFLRSAPVKHVLRGAPEEARLGLAWLLARVQVLDLSQAKWSSHLRHELGDRVGDVVEAWLVEVGIDVALVGGMTRSEWESAASKLRAGGF